MFASFLMRHGENDGFCFFKLLIPQICGLSLQGLLDAGNHVHQIAQGPHFFDLPHLGQKIFQGEG